MVSIFLLKTLLKKLFDCIMFTLLNVFLSQWGDFFSYNTIITFFSPDYNNFTLEKRLELDYNIIADIVPLLIIILERVR